ncbi:MAG: alkaline phosphatase D family protein [Gammaproteobacteria bacterium]|nr:alkaline phosphatase D family protein [Gammaproteobacteria bacterium]
MLHLGDYIYEYGDQTDGRLPLRSAAHEILTLEDYRRRYAFYRRTLAYQAAHRVHPFIAVWDDHESADNAWRDGARQTTIRRAKAPGASAAPRQYRCGTNGCRCAIPRHTRRSIAAPFPAISRTW